jgi:hypothetical protein
MSTPSEEAIAAAEKLYREFKEYGHGRNTVEHHVTIIQSAIEEATTPIRDTVLEAIEILNSNWWGAEGSVERSAAIKCRTILRKLVPHDRETGEDLPLQMSAAQPQRSETLQECLEQGKGGPPQRNPVVVNATTYPPCPICGKGHQPQHSEQSNRDYIAKNLYKINPETDFDDKGNLIRRSEPQEWTPEYVQSVTEAPLPFCKTLADAHNATLAAEREKRKQAEAMMLDAYDKAKEWRSQLAAAVEALENNIPALEYKGYKRLVEESRAALAKCQQKSNP